VLTDLWTSTIVRVILIKVSCHVKANFSIGLFLIHLFLIAVVPVIKLDELPHPAEIGFNKER